MLVPCPGKEGCDGVLSPYMQAATGEEVRSSDGGSKEEKDSWNPLWSQEGNWRPVGRGSESSALA